MKEFKIAHGIRQIPAHYRLLICLLFALIIFLITRSSATPAIQFIIFWISFALSNLILFWIIITTTQPAEIKLIAKKQDSNRTFIFLVVLIASFVSLFAVILLLKVLPDSKQGSYFFHISFPVISVMLSWILIHTIFTFRYAHLYYSSKAEEKDIQKEQEGGLQFPGDDEPDYLDFAYFSFVLGMTFQVSDVQITSGNIRSLALLHGLLSFVYNTTILALSINIISGLIEK